MTISDVSNVKTYTGNNSTTAYSTVFVFFDSSDLVVTLDGVTKTLDTDYTVTGGSGAVGTVTFTIAPGTDVAIIIQRVVAYEQQTDFENFDGNPADVTEKQFDLLAMQAQQLRDVTDRSLTVAVGSTTTTDLPTPSAGLALKWNPGATALINSTYDPDTQTAAAAASASAASNSASAASTSASNAATSETNASTSATLSSNWATKTDGVVASSEYASKAYAVGGTGVTSTSGKGAAKEWAITTGATVDTSEYSAKEYAIGTTVAAGSAKDWAILAEDSLVDGSGYSALHWAAKAAASAAGVNLPSIESTDTGAILQANAGGTAFELLTAGAAGKFLMSNGADAALSYETVSVDGLLSGSYVTNRYYAGGYVAYNSTPLTVIADKLYSVLFYVSETTTFTRIGMGVNATGAGSAARLGIYNYEGGIPTSLVLDCGTVDISGTGTKEATISQELAQGVYFVAIVFNGGADVESASGQISTLYSMLGTTTLIGNTKSIEATHSYAALPSTFPTVSYASAATSPLISLRVV